MKTSEIGVDEIQRCFRYDPISGVVTHVSLRCVGRAPKAPAGKVNKHGYIIFKFRGTIVRAHRIACVLMTGKWQPTTDGPICATFEDR